VYRERLSFDKEPLRVKKKRLFVNKEELLV
jgi:hypothetical protein